MTVADPAGDAPAAGDRDGLPRRGFRRLAEQGPGLLEGPVPSQSPCLQPLTPVRAHLRQAMTSSSYAGNPRFGYECPSTGTSVSSTPSTGPSFPKPSASNALAGFVSAVAGVISPESRCFPMAAGSMRVQAVRGGITRVTIAPGPT